MAGFYTEYFSTLLKGLWATSIKERREASRIINNLRKADYVLYKSLFEDVEREHRVTKSLKEEEKLIKELKKSAENAYSLLFNLSTEEMLLLKEVEDILKELENFSKSIATLPKSVSSAQIKKVEREFALAMYNALKKAEREEREEYKQIMLVIEEAEEKNTEKFMSKIRLAFQKETSQTILAKFAIRQEIKRARIDISKLKQIPVKIKAFRRRLAEMGKKENAEQVIGQLYGTIQEIKKYLNDAFYEIFLIQKRDILLTLKIIVDLNNLKRFNLKWVGKHFMPQTQIQEKNDKIDEVEKKLGKDFHIIAQAFRIIVSKIQKLEAEAKEDALI